MIFDTDILIWFFRGNENARNEVSKAENMSFFAVTYMEAVQGMKSKQELERLKKLINDLNVEIIPLTPQITEKAMSLVEEKYLSNSMEMGDALIAATCLLRGETVFTSNYKHYKLYRYS